MLVLPSPKLQLYDTALEEVLEKMTVRPLTERVKAVLGVVLTTTRLLRTEVSAATLFDTIKTAL